MSSSDTGWPEDREKAPRSGLPSLSRRREAGHSRGLPERMLKVSACGDMRWPACPVTAWATTAGSSSVRQRTCGQASRPQGWQGNPFAMCLCSGEGKVHEGPVEPSTVQVGVSTATAIWRGAEQLPTWRSASAMHAAISRSPSMRSGKSRASGGQAEAIRRISSSSPGPQRGRKRNEASCSDRIRTSSAYRSAGQRRVAGGGWGRALSGAAPDAAPVSAKVPWPRHVPVL